jgi:hypothetical protein
MFFITKVQHWSAAMQACGFPQRLEPKETLLNLSVAKLTFHRRQRERVLSGVLDGGSHGVLEELEQDVVEVRRNVDELDRVLPAVVLRPDFADLKRRRPGYDPVCLW